jgi:hypothetical protein
MINAPLDLSEQPTANEVHRFRTKRFEIRCAINARVESRLLSLPRYISAKYGGCNSEKRFKISHLRNPH